MVQALRRNAHSSPPPTPPLTGPPSRSMVFALRRQPEAQPSQPPDARSLLSSTHVAVAAASDASESEDGARSLPSCTPVAATLAGAGEPQPSRRMVFDLRRQPEAHPTGCLLPAVEHTRCCRRRSRRVGGWCTFSAVMHTRCHRRRCRQPVSPAPPSCRMAFALRRQPEAHPSSPPDARSLLFSTHVAVAAASAESEDGASSPPEYTLVGGGSRRRRQRRR